MNLLKSKLIHMQLTHHQTIIQYKKKKYFQSIVGFFYPLNVEIKVVWSYVM